MKAEDLMIGDWILYGGKPVQVLQLSEGKDYKHISPIPITPEILEKNGAIRTNLHGEQQHFTYTLRGFEMLAIYDADFSYQINGSARKIKYVHELQHALRICGIEKEIEI